MALNISHVKTAVVLVLLSQTCMLKVSSQPQFKRVRPFTPPALPRCLPTLAPPLSATSTSLKKKSARAAIASFDACPLTPVVRNPIRNPGQGDIVCRSVDSTAQALGPIAVSGIDAIYPDIDNSSPIFMGARQSTGGVAVKGGMPPAPVAGEGTDGGPLQFLMVLNYATQLKGTSTNHFLTVVYNDTVTSGHITVLQALVRETPSGSKAYTFVSRTNKPYISPLEIGMGPTAATGPSSSAATGRRLLADLKKAPQPDPLYIKTYPLIDCTSVVCQPPPSTATLMAKKVLKIVNDAQPPVFLGGVTAELVTVLPPYYKEKTADGLRSDYITYLVYTPEVPEDPVSGMSAPAGLGVLQAQYGAVAAPAGGDSLQRLAFVSVPAPAPSLSNGTMDCDFITCYEDPNSDENARLIAGLALERFNSMRLFENGPVSADPGGAYIELYGNQTAEFGGDIFHGVQLKVVDFFNNKATLKVTLVDPTIFGQVQGANLCVYPDPLIATGGCKQLWLIEYSIW